MWSKPNGADDFPPDVGRETDVGASADWEAIIGPGARTSGAVQDDGASNARRMTAAGPVDPGRPVDPARQADPGQVAPVLPLFTVAFDDSLLGWQERALCAQTDPEAFFPEKGGSTREAKRVCTGCEVRVDCLEYALANDERFGIWGGLSERERRKLRRRVV
jgi:WhiB family redox-sensing transcriptional regulator